MLAALHTLSPHPRTQPITNILEALNALPDPVQFTPAASFLVDALDAPWTDATDAEQMVHAARGVMRAAGTGGITSPERVARFAELMEDLAVVTRNAIPLPEAGAFEWLLDALQRHGQDLHVVKAVSSALTLYTEDAGDTGDLFELGVPAQLIIALHNHVADADTVLCLSKSLSRLFALAGPAAGTHAALYIAYDGAVHALVDAMELHRDDADVQSACVQAVCHLYVDPGTRRLREELLMNGARGCPIHDGLGEVLLAALKWHCFDEAIVLHGLRVVAALAHQPRNRSVWKGLGAVAVVKSVQMRNQLEAKATLDALLHAGEGGG
jgi:hypothetical protein